MFLEKHSIFEVRIIILVLFSLKDMLDKFLNFPEILSNPFLLLLHLLLPLHLLIDIELMESHPSSSPCITQMVLPLLLKDIIVLGGSMRQSISIPNFQVSLNIFNESITQL